MPGDIPDGIEVDAALFLHADGAADPAARGFSFGYPDHPVNKRLADLIRAEILRIPGHPPARQDNYTVDMRRYYGYSRVVSPGPEVVLHETAFLTNTQERRWARSHVNAIARAHFPGALPLLRPRHTVDPNSQKGRRTMRVNFGRGSYRFARLSGTQMRSIANARCRFVALVVLALTAGVASGEAGGLVSSEAQALQLHGVGLDGGAEIIGYDCTGRAITRFDTPPTWCPPSAPVAVEASF